MNFPQEKNEELKREMKKFVTDGHDVAQSGSKKYIPRTIDGLKLIKYSNLHGSEPSFITLSTDASVLYEDFAADSAQWKVDKPNKEALLDSIYEYANTKQHFSNNNNNNESHSQTDDEGEETQEGTPVQQNSKPIKKS